MASKPVAAAKQLSELLQEQQEPFILDAYIATESEVSFSCWSCNSSKLLKSSASSGLNKGRKVLPNCSKTVRAVFHKLISISIHNHRIKNSVSRDGDGDGDGDFSVTTEIQRSCQYVEESDRFSSASSATVFNSCSESDGEDASNPNSSHKDHILDTAAHTFLSCNIATDRKLGWRCTKDKIKQIGPVSVLAHNKKKHKAKVMKPVASSTSKLQKPNLLEKPSFTNPSSQYLNSTRLSSAAWNWSLGIEIDGIGENLLQQRNQLFFDCVRDAVDTHVWKKKNRRRRHLRQVLGPEELGKLLLSENIMTWSKQSADETNMTQLLNLDFLASIEEWSDFEFHIMEISMQIVDVILEDIGNEIVTDMIEYFESSLC